MKDSVAAFCFGAVIGFLLAIVLAFPVTVASKDAGRRGAIMEAMKAGAAEWAADENGRPEIKWKGGCDEQ